MDARLKSSVALLGLWLVVLALAVWPAGAEAMADAHHGHQAPHLAMSGDADSDPAADSESCLKACCAALAVLPAASGAQPMIVAGAASEATSADGLRLPPPHGPPKAHA
jgi:hypothetical protein